MEIFVSSEEDEMTEYLIPACSGKSMDIAEGQTISVIDVEGGQVAFFAEYAVSINFYPKPLRLTATNR